MPSHPLGQWQPCPTCCVVGCVYYSTTFDGENSTTVPGFTETSGDWEIETNSLRTAGAIAKVFIGDSDYYAELEAITSTCGHLRLYDNTDVTPVCKGMMGVDLSPWTRLIVCSDETNIHVGATGATNYLTIPATVASDVVALGVDDSVCTCTTLHPTSSNKYLAIVTIKFDGSYVRFEDFALSKHFDDDATCPGCGPEQCPWFRDDGCASGSLAAADYTTTGTWEYAGGLKCTAAGAAQVIVEHPAGEATGSIFFRVASLAAGTTLSVDPDGAGVLSVVCSADGQVRLFKSGVEYGAGGLWTPDYRGVFPSGIRVLCDGTNVYVHILDSPMYSNVPHCVGSAPYTPTAMAPKFTVTASGTCSAIFGNVQILKTTIASGDCAVPMACCNGCAPGTQRTEGTATVDSLTSHVYGCACPGPIAVSLRACDPYQLLLITAMTGLDVSSAACTWIGSYNSGGVYIDVGVVAVQDGANYRLSAGVAWGKLGVCGFAVAALFQETIAGAQPNCTIDIAGDVPWLSAHDHTEQGSGGANHSSCTAESATLSLAFP